MEAQFAQEKTWNLKEQTAVITSRVRFGRGAVAVFFQAGFVRAGIHIIRSAVAVRVRRCRVTFSLSFRRKVLIIGDAIAIGIRGAICISRAGFIWRGIFMIWYAIFIAVGAARMFR